MCFVWVGEEVRVPGARQAVQDEGMRLVGQRSAGKDGGRDSNNDDISS